ncbi:hypothetical protein MPSEU_000551600 [Mayamaea pseudoterrestris]|nr:hypothetical protein MPSEU_000551600 [Mayamaea pseudoterrestris]
MASMNDASDPLPDAPMEQDDDEDANLQTQRTNGGGDDPAAAVRDASVQSPSTKPVTQPFSSPHINKTTTIDGCNLWSSWTRNYSTPLLAFWDLMDNSFDASCSSHGRIIIEADYCSENSDHDGNGKAMPATKNVCGMVVTNSCKHPIADLKDILKAYNSEKKRSSNGENGDGDDHHATSIGENGVGLKQGCATLSDLSFVLTKSRSGDVFCKFSLGVISKDLQKSSGVYLPSFDLLELSHAQRNDLLERGNNIDNSLHSLVFAKLQTLVETDPDVNHVLQVYGQGSVKAGIHSLAKHYERMLLDWRNDAHVFTLVLHHLKHSSSSSSASSHLEQVTHDNDDDNAPSPDNLKRIAVGLRTKPERMDQAKTVGEFLGMIREDLPKRYLHIQNSFSVLVGNVNANVNDNKMQVEFNYWQRRLVEMTHFQVIVNTQQPLSSEQMAQRSVVASENNGYATALGSNEYLLNVYLGFDADRCASDTEHKTAAMHCHSRKAGRLIKTFRDARNDLFLTSGGTQYCQGLTVIVDDVNGMLPLNPTKQDFAFGERAHGEVHRDNMVAMVGAVTKVYWTYHFEVTHANRKELLSKQIKSLAKDVKRWKKNDSFMPSISECNFSTISGLAWKLFKKKEGPTALQVKNKQVLKLVPGKDTLIKFPIGIAKPAKQPAKKKKAPVEAEFEEDDDEPEPEEAVSSPLAARGSQKRKSAPTNTAQAAPKRAAQASTTTRERVDAPMSPEAEIGGIHGEMVPYTDYAFQFERVQKYKDKARKYHDERNESRKRVTELSAEVASLKQQLRTLEGNSNANVDDGNHDGPIREDNI